ncbi:hypothetical protein [Solidesulfovibrio fructosivorans]|uniref:hypothetical protein n=1 Tax=Solidesulfovibrio fructosivorans TaxID=878 RepID=UPI00117E76BA|nr:hypothetical protein [Solidesulfovibrio fructosivorans]
MAFKSATKYLNDPNGNSISLLYTAILSIDTVKSLGLPQHIQLRIVEIEDDLIFRVYASKMRKIILPTRASELKERMRTAFHSQEEFVSLFKAIFSRQETGS